MVGFLFGGSTNETPETLKRKRELAMAIMGASAAPKNVGEGLNALGSGIVAGVMNRRADKAEKEGQRAAGALRQQFYNSITAAAPDVSASSMISPGVKPSAGTASAGDVDMSGNDIYSSFMDTVDNTIKNPFGLAAVAATGKAESSFSPGNVNRTWSDPSQSGDPGTAGGIMSWRGPRLESLQAFAAKKGEQGNGSPQTQAEFLLQEDPNLVTALNGAKSTEEAQQIMNNAWKFAGYNQPGGEAANRLGYANAFLPNFQGQGQPQQVASLDPSIGMSSAGPQPAAPMQGPPMPSLSDEVAAFEKTPEYAARFPGQNVGGSPSQAPPLAPPVEVAAPAVPPTAPPMGQQPGQQIAQAQPQQQSGPDQALLYQILTHPFSTPEDKAMAKMMLEQQAQQAGAQREQQVWMQRQQYETEQKRSDPSYQLGLKKTQAELDQMGKPEYRTLTPEERKQYGIPDNDQRLYQVSRGGKVDAVGGAGQTINVGNEVEARKAAAAQVGLSPEDPAYQGFILTGKLPREDAQTLTATDKKALWAAEDEVPLIDNTLSALDQAKDLNRRTFTGTGAGILGTIGTNVPGAGVLIDTDKAKATSEFNKLMSMEAIQSMAQTLKGATTDSELARFVDILADPSTDPDIRERTIDRMISLANRVKDVKDNRIKQLRGGGISTPGAGKTKTTIGGYTIEEE
ncbi:phage tail tip lysozyme [Sinorhizobium medicae]|uniref:phage tail tip lysozyme n=1 Tax=Sinorhizobium medicae TaxID=110321 RepID=UPI002AF6A34A|nr:phage tail tip lysozyme [Sinorhizobium medicae]WQO85233.1 phage tail tip lysozyme [Sinorhizobium medicae]